MIWGVPNFWKHPHCFSIANMTPPFPTRICPSFGGHHCLCIRLPILRHPFQLSPGGCGVRGRLGSGELEQGGAQRDNVLECWKGTNGWRVGEILINSWSENRLWARYIPRLLNDQKSIKYDDDQRLNGAVLCDAPSAKINSQSNK